MKRLHKGILSGLILCAPFWFGVYFALSATYYVDNDGNDACSGLSQTIAASGECAWKTIAKVNASTFSAGDNILFRRGDTWLEEMTIPSSGSEGSPITFGVYGAGDKPIISGSNTRATSISATSKNYITIQNLNLTGWTQRGVFNTGGNGWIVEDCDISGGSGTGGTANRGINFRIVTDTKITGGIIRNNTIGPIGVGAATLAQKESLFFRGIILQGVDSHLIENNYIACDAAGGIQIDQGTAGSGNNSANIIKGNEITGCTMGIGAYYSDDTIVDRNRIHDGTGLGIASGYTSARTIIRRNLIYDLATGSTLWNGIDINNNSQNGFVYNNVVVGVHNHSLTLENAVAASNGWTVKNNVFDARLNTGSAVPLKAWQVTTLTMDYNDLVPFSATKDYGTTLITNGSFETFTGTPDNGVTDDFTGWTEATGTGALTEAITNADSTFSCKLTRGSTGATAITITAEVVAMTPYELRYLAKYTSGTGRVAIYKGANFLQNDGSWSSTANWSLTPLAISSGDTNWTAKTLGFIPSETGAITIRIENMGATGTVLGVDSFEMYRQGNVVANYSPGTANYRPYDFASWKTASSQDTHSINADPKFIDPANGNFRLQSTSPLINAGVVL